jgi:hypothetical protein
MGFRLCGGAVLVLGLATIGGGAAQAEERVVAASLPRRLKDPCPGAGPKGTWVKLPEGGPRPGSRPEPATARFDGKTFAVGLAGGGAALDVCRATWNAAPAPARTAAGGGVELDGARLVPGYDPRRSSYDGFATGRLVLPSGREIPLAAAGAPSPRTYEVIAFDGRRLMVWGGFGPTPDDRRHVAFGDGAVFDTKTRRWRPMSASGAPSARYLPIAAWTGSRLIIWGGGAGVPGGEPTLFGDGAVYDPARDRWSPMSAEGAPAARWKPVTIWTGDVLVLAGGGDVLITGGARGRDDAYVYDPAANRWFAVEGAPRLAERHWVRSFVDGRGRVLFVDTHVLKTFGVLDPAARRFDEVRLPETLQDRSGMGVAWTGARLLLWGGYRQVPGYVNPCASFTGPGGCDPPSPPFAVFADGWAYAPP